MICVPAGASAAGLSAGSTAQALAGDRPEPLSPVTQRMLRKAGVGAKDMELLAGQYVNRGFTPQELAGAPDEMRRLMAGAEAPRSRLDDARRRLRVYAAKEGPEPLDGLMKDRKQALEELYALLKQLEAEEKKIGAISKRWEVETWAGVIAGTQDPKMLAAMQKARDFDKEAHRFVKMLGEELEEEEKAYAQQLARIQSERDGVRRLGLPLLMLAVGGALLGVFGWVLWLLQKANRRLTEVTQRLTSPPSPASPPGSPELIAGNYRIERELGRGAMGVVFEAFDLALQRRVAVKRIREELREDPNELGLFLNEARLVASLRHPQIVEIFAVLEENGQVYLLFEFVPGRALSKALSQEGRLSLSESLRLTREIGSALDHAHAHRVVHRDLKPSNVMLCEDRSAKVMDFGIAHQAQRTVARLTRVASWGTPPYMAPEQELGSVSSASDLFSLAVCFYEMAVGRLPFEGPNYLAQKRELRFERPSRALGSLPAALDAVLEKALAPEPASRYASAAELAAALESAS